MIDAFCPLIHCYAAQGKANRALKFAGFLMQFLEELGMVLSLVDREQFDRTVEASKTTLT